MKGPLIAGNKMPLRYPPKTVKKVIHAKKVILQESLRYSDAKRLDSLRLFATVDKEIPRTKMGNDIVASENTDTVSAFGRISQK